MFITQSRSVTESFGNFRESNYEYYVTDKDALLQVRNIFLQCIQLHHTQGKQLTCHSLFMNSSTRNRFFNESLYRNCSPTNTGNQLIAEHPSPSRCNHKTRGFLQLRPMISVSRATAVQPAGEGLMQRSCDYFQDWPFWWQFCVPGSPTIN
jgi:hypothetical protein